MSVPWKENIFNCVRQTWPYGPFLCMAWPWQRAGHLSQWFAKVIAFTVSFNHKVLFITNCLWINSPIRWLTLKHFLAVRRNIAAWKMFMLILNYDFSLCYGSQKKLSINKKSFLIQSKALSKHSLLKDAHIYAKSWFTLSHDFLQLCMYNHSSTDV